MSGILDRLPPPDRSGVGEDGQPSHVWRRAGVGLRLRLGPEPELTVYRGGRVVQTVEGSYELVELMAKRYLEHPEHAPGG